ncbi:endothelial cell adhesion molecule a [Centropristis striata]|uniref:endothelial cell adhesion molecule a n=1 Tax=Centropristis striata TaxID=184440 RepID=UPI0027E17B61|nr:endothelial cell adhesion molecule a [Centropristis striata]
MEVCTTSRKLTLLSFTFLCGLAGILAQLEMPQLSMNVVKGQTVVLRALYNTGSDPSANTIIWNFVTNKTSTKLVISHTKGFDKEGDVQFRGRVQFATRQPSRDLSLRLNDTEEADSGRYVCQVISPDDGGHTAEVRLEVKVPPAVPKCSMSGKPVLKGNVTLSCSSSSGKPTPLYKWKKTSPTNEVFFSPMLNEKLGTLTLNNLSRNMSGKYVCTASNSAGSETCLISLDIVTSNNVGMIVGAVVGPVLGVLFLLCIGYFLLKRQRYSEDDMANEIKEDAQAPKRVSWAKSGMGSDIISKNGTMSSIGSSPHHKEPSHHHHNNHHHHLQQYPQRPPSDTASIITATGSMAGYRPSSRHHGASTPTHFSYNNNTTLPRGQTVSSEDSVNGSSLPRPERYTQLPQAQVLPQTYSQPHKAAPIPPPLPTSTITASNIARMGGVPIMVPAQNQAGSLV